MKHIKKMQEVSDRYGDYVSYLYPVNINDLPNLCTYLKKNRVNFDLYENGLKFIRSNMVPVKDCLVYIEASKQSSVFYYDPFMKINSLKFRSKQQISKWVGAKIKDVDLYIDMKKYNL